MAKVYLETFGCQMNISDSEMLLDLLRQRGFTSIDDPRLADLIVVNTCSVREKAEKKAISKLMEYASVKKQGAELWAIGCMAENYGDELIKQNRGINKVIGAPKLETLPFDIDNYLTEFGFNEITQNSGGHPRPSAFVPVMRGCDNFCTYCIVPHVRGREHSVSADLIISQCETLVSQGVSEITLLGQNVNSYNYKGLDFPKLLSLVNDVDGLKRIRFTTSHPKDISDKLIEVVATSPKLCNHIHLPVQSGSDRILNVMNRKYTVKHYLDKVAKIRDILPAADITTDVMVGFPTESESDFNATLDLFKKVRFTSAFMFAYSSREGTGAARMEGQVESKIKKDRLNKLISLQTGITKEHYSNFVDRKIEVLFTERQKKHEKSWIGTDFGFKRAILSTNDDLFGKIETVKVVRSSGMTLVCERM